ncbi:MAG TPA: extracellular solute-binding protein [candidate division Zixibacteria bacterium]|nr:extracellular solute-binding protein [candidate division Zixibacteria bacterium]
MAGGRRLPAALLLLILLGVVFPAPGPAQTREAVLGAIAKIHGAEREARLSEGARKEGGLVWYSSTTAEDSLALVRQFEGKYPHVKVQHLRSPSEKMLTRILTESRAGSFKADVVALPELELNLLFKRNLLSRYDSPEQAVYPVELKDPRGYWTGMYITAWVTAYNTKLVSARSAPKTYKDLLLPKWKGGIGMDEEPYSWFITSLRYLEKPEGKPAAVEYFKRLARQGIQWRKGHSLIGQLVAAGEFPIAAELQVHTVERLKAQGAPIDWAALDGVIPINKVGMAMTGSGSNTHAAALFYDFVLSRAGMETIRGRHRIPTRPDVTVPYLKPYRLLPFDSQAMEDFDKYVSLFRDLLKPGS